MSPPGIDAGPVGAGHACGDECDSHATGMGHCRVCADACRRCEQAVASP